MAVTDPLVTAWISRCPEPWTMAMMEDGPEQGESDEAFERAQCEAARRLIEQGHVPLYGVWGSAAHHARVGATHMAVFPEGTKVLATYKRSN